MVTDELARLAAQFTQDMLNGFDTLSREIGYRPTRFRQLVQRVGGRAAAKQLVRGPLVSDGFATLAVHNRYEQTVEAWVLRPEYAPLFDDDDLAFARRRLEAHEFDVDRYLRRLADRENPTHQCNHPEETP